MTLRFGKFKGQKFNNTPKWYQEWLLKQDWFNAPKTKAKPLHNQLNGWDGYSSRGQAIYDAIFQQEQNEMIVLGLECKCGLPKFKEDEYCSGDYCSIEG
tara:strand:- start:11556 stop:11852 length:297 start_codon:yes stop_codon:yes gene_type:complete